MGIASDVNKERGKWWANIGVVYVALVGVIFCVHTIDTLHSAPEFNPVKLKAQCEQVLQMRCTIVK